MYVNPQVSTNGLISFSNPYTAYIPRTFPISNIVVAPYWDDSDTTVKGFVRYAVITDNHPTLSCLLNVTSHFISSKEGVHFEASWVLVARWVDLCPYLNNKCTEVIIMIELNYKNIQSNLFIFCFGVPHTGKQLPGSSGHKRRTVICSVHLPVWRAQLDWGF